MQYLEGRQRSLSNPYAIALVSYALANEGRLNQQVLFRHASSGKFDCVYPLLLKQLSHHHTQWRQEILLLI